jgi:hypothetical protein
MFSSYTNNSMLSTAEIARLMNRSASWVNNRLSEPRCGAREYHPLLPKHDRETLKRHGHGANITYLWKLATIKQFIIDNRLEK